MNCMYVCILTVVLVTKEPWATVGNINHELTNENQGLSFWQDLKCMTREIANT